MSFLRWVVIVLMVAGGWADQTPKLSSPDTVTIPSGDLRLKAFLWKPAGAGPFPAVLFNHGSGGVDAAHTAGMPITEAAERLAPVFLKHGYAFLYLFRRGQGLSSEQAPFMQELLRKEEASKGTVARQQLQFKLATQDHLDDVLAALAFLRTVAGVDPQRIAIVGHSFGGQLTLLAAERDPSVKAAVTFAAAAASWNRSPELRERLLTAVRTTNAAIMLTEAANDYSTTAAQSLAAELQRLHKPHLLKIYPPVGSTAEDGHNALYEALPEWEGDVFSFLDKYDKREAAH
jgi:dienelactone hydrolase